MSNSFRQTIIGGISGNARPESRAFVIGGETWTYGQLFSLAAQISARVKDLESDLVCLYAVDDVRTYAAILALWSVGKAYVPLNPVQPLARHIEVIHSVDAECVISADPKYAPGLEGVSVLDTSVLSALDGGPVLEWKDVPDDSLAYVIFTSGSTGVPKGVPITRGNLAAFIDSIDATELQVTASDRCLQPFDLTFDFSVSSYVIPLVNGACIYTVPPKAIKFLYIASLIEDHRLTLLQMVPSMMRNLLPYIAELDLSSVHYNVFCGEALLVPHIRKWHGANPEMLSFNMYGPTEDTVFCTYYLIDKRNIDGLSASNDIVSIGISYKNNSVLLENSEGKVVGLPGEEGELCLAGAQLTPGYWRNPEENGRKFFLHDGVRYYRSGDLCYYAPDGTLMFLGRKDFQVKINGFRVELREIEKHFADASGGRFSVAVPVENAQGNIEIALVVEGKEYDCSAEKEYLASRLPKYEIPSRWLFMRSIPMNQNGKVDRKAVKEFIDSKEK